MTNLWLTCFTHRTQQNSIRYLRISIENTVGIRCIGASHRIAAAVFEVPNVVQAHRYDESTGTMSTIASLDTVKSCLDHRTGSLKRRGKRRGSWKLRMIGEKPPIFYSNLIRVKNDYDGIGRDGDRMGFVQKNWNCLLNSTKYHTNLWKWISWLLFDRGVNMKGPVKQQTVIWEWTIEAIGMDGNGIPPHEAPGSSSLSRCTASCAISSIRTIDLWATIPVI